MIKLARPRRGDLIHCPAHGADAFEPRTCIWLDWSDFGMGNGMHKYLTALLAALADGAGF